MYLRVILKPFIFYFLLPTNEFSKPFQNSIYQKDLYSSRTPGRKQNHNSRCVVADRRVEIPSLIDPTTTNNTIMGLNRAHRLNVWHNRCTHHSLLRALLFVVFLVPPRRHLGSFPISCSIIWKWVPSRLFLFQARPLVIFHKNRTFEGMEKATIKLLTCLLFIWQLEPPMMKMKKEYLSALLFFGQFGKSKKIFTSHLSLHSDVLGEFHDLSWAHSLSLSLNIGQAWNIVRRSIWRTR